MAKGPDVDRSLRDSARWRKEVGALREILLGCGLSEELKWGSPCYVDGGKNICIIQAMKDSLAEALGPTRRRGRG